MKLIKHVAIAMTLTFTTAAFAEKPEVQDVRRKYEKDYVKMCEGTADLSGKMLQGMYLGFPLSMVIGPTENRSIQAVAIYVYQQPYMASEAGRRLQEQQVKNTVFAECLRDM